MASPSRADVLRRSLGARQVDGLVLLDAVRLPDGEMRVFFGNGSDLGVIDAAAVAEMRQIGGGAMIRLPASPDALLPLRAGGTMAFSPSPDETALFAGLNVQLACRTVEPAETVAEGLAYHARHHGLQAALIINRAPPDDQAGFADALAVALADLSLRVVVIDSPVPLGQPDTGPESHPFLAPDAPGKDRMDRPLPDAWLSPLAEAAIFEAMKWRFLARARAVLCLDVCDILDQRAAGAPTAFDLCLKARRGVILLVGRRIYPWRVRPGRPARFGDHICRPFDSRRGMARWGAAPERAGLDNTWRAHRVAYAKPDPGLVVPFWRAMAIRVPDTAPAALVPKTALVEDPALIALATGPFAHNPVRAPVSAPRVEAATSGRTAIVTTMKNEGPFILEWIAWHRAIGVDDFLVYTNDCTDGTDTLLDLLQEKGIVQHRDNPFRSTDLKPQHAALQAAEDEAVIRDSGWTICMDVDEFINIKLGDGRLPTLYAAMEAAMPGANMISLTWRLFGNGPVRAYEDRFVIEQFDRAAPELIRKPHQAWGFKTLFRNIDIYRKLGVHRPKGLRPDLWDQVRWLNGSGRPMPREMFRNGWRSTTETYGYDWVQLNHYAVRSAESFLVKRDRGRVNHVDRDQGLNYWFRMNHNADRDTSIQRRLPLLRAEFDRLMADPDIAAAHADCVARHRAKIAALMTTETYARFYGELTGERMERLCRLQHHFGSAVFTAGPGAIPLDLPLTDLPPDFFFTLAEAGEA